MHRSFGKSGSRIFLSSLVAYSLAGCTAGDKKGELPNIICFYSDEMDPGYLGVYGADKWTTPNLDSLALNGVWFSRAYSVAPMCTPSRYAVLTGKYPGRCSHPVFLDVFPPERPYSIEWNTWIRPGSQTIASILSGNGYFTGMNGKFHAGHLPGDVDLPELNENIGLDSPEADQLLAEHQRILVEQLKRITGFDRARSLLWGNYGGSVPGLHFHNFPWMTKGAIDFLEEAAQRDTPFFLYSATTSVHGPNHTASLSRDITYTMEGRMPELEKYQLPVKDFMAKTSELSPSERHRAAGMASLDHHVGLVLNKLRELGMDENTLIIFMADHNTEPGKTTCYEKGLKVPMIIYWPGRTVEGQACVELVQSVDVLPTIMEAARVDPPEDVILDGKSLVPLLTDPAMNIRDYLYAESGITRAIISDRYKYIAFHYPALTLDDMISGKIDYAPNHLNSFKQSHSSIAMEFFPHYFDADQLYDLYEDPYELTNLAYQQGYSGRLDSMKNILNHFLATFRHPYPFRVHGFRKTREYKRLVGVTKALGTDYIPWYDEDWDDIGWPPRE